MEYGATVCDPHQKYNSDKIEKVQCRAAGFVKSRYSRYPNVSDMLDVLGWTPLYQRRQEARLILFYKIINRLAQVPFEPLSRHIRVLEENAIQLASMDSRFFLKLLVHETGLLSLKLRHWLYLDQILIKISVHPFRIIP